MKTMMITHAPTTDPTIAPVRSSPVKPDDFKLLFPVAVGINRVAVREVNRGMRVK